MPLPVSGGVFFNWSRDGKAVYYTAEGNLWMASIENSRERRLTDFTGKQGQPRPYAIDTDGDYVYFTWRDDVSDIWVMDVAQE